MNTTTVTSVPRSIRLTPNELETLKRAAQRVGMPWTRFLRSAGIAVAQRVIPPTPASVRFDDGELVPLTDMRGAVLECCSRCGSTTVVARRPGDVYGECER